MEVGLHPILYFRDDGDSGDWICDSNSKKFVEWYLDLDIEEIRDLVSEFKKMYIKGFYESEGSIYEPKEYITPNLFVYNTDKELIGFYKSLLQSEGFQTSTYCRKRSTRNLYECRLEGGSEEIIRFLDWINPCTKNISQERRQKIADYLQKLEEKHRLYDRAIKLRKERGWGSWKIAKKLGIKKRLVGSWIYEGKKPRGMREEEV